MDFMHNFNDGIAKGAIAGMHAAFNMRDRRIFKEMADRASRASEWEGYARSLEAANQQLHDQVTAAIRENISLTLANESLVADKACMADCASAQYGKLQAEVGSRDARIRELEQQLEAAELANIVSERARQHAEGKSATANCSLAIFEALYSGLVKEVIHRDMLDQFYSLLPHVREQTIAVSRTAYLSSGKQVYKPDLQFTYEDAARLANGKFVEDTVARLIECRDSVEAL